MYYPKTYRRQDIQIRQFSLNGQRMSYCQLPARTLFLKLYPHPTGKQRWFPAVPAC